MFEKGNFKLKSDFDIRIVREDNKDIDLFVDLKYRTLDLNIGENNLDISRIQFPKVRGIIIRFNENEYVMTCHILRDIDLHSSFANFEINYKNSVMGIVDLKEKVVLQKIKWGM